MTWRDYFLGNEDSPGLLKNLSKRIGLLKKLRKYMPENKFKNIVAGTFTSKMIYCMTVWGGIWGLSNQRNCERRSMAITKQEMKKLQTLQNKIMRLISGLEYGTSTKLLLEKTKMLSVHQMVVYHTACQTYKILKSMSPEYHYNRLSSSINPTRQDTRSKENNLVRIDFKLSLARSSYFYQAPQVWSSLPLQIRMLKTRVL